MFLPFFEAFSNKVYYAIQINLVDFVKSLLRVLAEITFNRQTKTKQTEQMSTESSTWGNSCNDEAQYGNIAQNSNFIMF